MKKMPLRVLVEREEHRNIKHRMAMVENNACCTNYRRALEKQPTRDSIPITTESPRMFQKSAATRRAFQEEETV